MNQTTAKPTSRLEDTLLVGTSVCHTCLQRPEKTCKNKGFPAGNGFRTASEIIPLEGWCSSFENPHIGALKVTGA